MSSKKNGKKFLTIQNLIRKNQKFGLLINLTKTKYLKIKGEKTEENRIIKYKT